jgi:secreted trypsin-like serine protease
MKKLLFILLFLLGCSIVMPPTTAWKPGRYKSFNGIVMITTGWGKSQLCTGVAINSNTVLTAAHCLTYPAEDLYITYGCDYIKNKCKIIKVRETIAHWQYKKDYVKSDDLGIIITDKPIVNIIPAKIYAGDISEGIKLIPAGYGRRESQTGVLYSGNSTVARNYTYEFITKTNEKLDPNPGDSGGPIYIRTTHGLEIVGILSRGIVTYKGYSGLAIYTKTKPYLDWVGKMSYINE